MTSQTSTKNSNRASIVKTARESLSDKVLLKIEENEFLNYLYEQGINVEQLTEEELDELFGFNTRTSRDAVASSQSPKVRARRKKEQKDRIAKFTADRKASKPKPDAEPKPDAKPQAVPHNPTEEGGSYWEKRRKAAPPTSPKAGGGSQWGGLQATLAAERKKKRKETAPKSALDGFGKKKEKENIYVDNSSTQIVKKGRMALAERVLEAFQKGLKDKARAIQQASPGTRNQSAVDQAARATGDATIKKSQGKNTPRSMFGGNSNQTSTTAGGGTLGQELAKTKPESQHSMNRRGSSTVDKKKVAANLANAKSGKNAASLEKEIAADTEKRRAAKRAEG